MPLPTQITDYSTFDAPPYLISYFGSGSDVARWEAALDVQLNQLEQAIFDLINQIWLDNALGAQLDALGANLGLPRNGMDDTTYRTMLSVTASINRAGGTPEAAINMVRAALGDPKPKYVPLYPAAFKVVTHALGGFAVAYDLSTNSGATMVDNHGNTIEVGIFSLFTSDQVAQIAPSGVAVSVTSS